MCCTLHPAKLSGTILYAGEADRKGKLVHVTGYLNHARNMIDGPNAMILPFPAYQEMTEANCMDATGTRWIFKNMVDAIQPVTKSLSRGLLLGSSRAVKVFDSGVYTVVLAQDARSIPAALDRVPEEKRPEINEEIFDAYARWYPNHHIALCCFASRKDVESEPLLWWYDPIHPQDMFAPALDAHDGHAPVLGGQVSTDHTVLFGSTIAPRGAKIHHYKTVPDHIKWMLPDQVVGRTFRSSMPNGDFSLPLERFKFLDKNSFHSYVKVSRTWPVGARRGDSHSADILV